MSGIGEIDRLERLCDFLDRNLEWACDQAWADEFDSEVHQCWQRLRSAAHLRPDVRRSAAPCPVCGLRSLVRHGPQAEGQSPTVVCERSAGGCGLTILEEDRRDGPRWTAYLESQRARPKVEREDVA